MKIIISSAGKFHAFHLAEELQKRNSLGALLTSYYDPNRNGKGYTIDPSLVKTYLPAAILTYAHRFLPFLRRLGFWKQFGREFYAQWAARSLPQGDILIAWSGRALYSIRAAKTKGMMTVVERGSAHIVRQWELLNKEYERLNVKGRLPSKYVIEKEIQEYTEADYIAIPSTFVKRTFIDQGIPADKLVQIPYGASLEHFKPVPKNDGIFRVMHIGGSPQKGTQYLLQAMSELNLGNSELLLVGTLHPLVKKLLERYNGDYKLLSSVSHLQLFQVYSQSSTYISPSVQDGFGMVIIEAMACGVPVICSTNTAGEDIIRDGIDGFVVPVGDVNALKQRILFLYENKTERQAMGNAAMLRAKEFTWDRYGERIVETYGKLLAELVK